MKSNHRIWITCLIIGVGALVLFGPGVADLLASGDEGAKNMNPLESLQRNLGLWTIVTFLVTLGILWKYAFGPIVEGLDKREKYIHDQRSGAEEANATAQQLLEDYKQQLASAKQEIQTLYDKSAAINEKARAQMVETAKQEVETIKTQATQEIASAKVQAKKELAAASATLAVEIAGKILQKQLDPNAHKDLIDQTIAKF